MLTDRAIVVVWSSTPQHRRRLREYSEHGGGVREQPIVEAERQTNALSSIMSSADKGNVN